MVTLFIVLVVTQPHAFVKNHRIVLGKKKSLLHMNYFYNRFPSPGTWQRDWEHPGNLTLKSSGIWLQNLHKTEETDSWKAEAKPCAHQDPGERSNDPTRDWPGCACECPGVSGRDVGGQWPVAGSGALNTTVLAQDLLKEVAIIFIIPTIVWSQVKQ